MPVRDNDLPLPHQAQPPALDAASEAPTVRAPRRPLSPAPATTVSGKTWRIDPLVAGLSLAAALLVGVILSALLISRSKNPQREPPTSAATQAPTAPTAAITPPAGDTSASPATDAERGALIPDTDPAPDGSSAVVTEQDTPQRRDRNPQEKANQEAAIDDRRDRTEEEPRYEERGRGDKKREEQRREQQKREDEKREQQKRERERERERDKDRDKDE